LCMKRSFLRGYAGRGSKSLGTSKIVILLNQHKQYFC
jgi:hypothetical protein